ncbi:MAG: hypothetical protein BWY86_01301 [Candidatus Aminicenantes bacterium ADurb.Bin508]|jgi:hypothetical protein|nr:MAG: hypothetical protein BWY86_01301 [Candidatus Aminicenantes bacterium ADurb.Bin508]
MCGILLVLEAGRGAKDWTEAKQQVLSRRDLRAWFYDGAFDQEGFRKEIERRWQVAHETKTGVPGGKA